MEDLVGLWIRPTGQESCRCLCAFFRAPIDGGNVVAFEIIGGKAGRNFLDKIKLCSLSPGDTRTIVTHPASTTHSKLSVDERLAVSITDGLVRVSVGLETVKDVIADLEQAL
jgi:O-succinylhomoserine sulfhydrylase